MPDRCALGVGAFRERWFTEWEEPSKGQAMPDGAWGEGCFARLIPANFSPGPEARAQERSSQERTQLAVGKRAAGCARGQTGSLAPVPASATGRVTVPPTWRSRLSRRGALRRAEAQEGQHGAQPLLHHGRRRELQRAVPQVQRGQRGHGPCGKTPPALYTFCAHKTGRDGRSCLHVREKVSLRI